MAQELNTYVNGESSYEFKVLFIHASHFENLGFA